MYMYSIHVCKYVCIGLCVDSSPYVSAGSTADGRGLFQLHLPSLSLTT